MFIPSRRRNDEGEREMKPHKHAEQFKALKEGDSWDFSCNELPKCPHCGEDYSIEDNESWRLYEDDNHDVECNACENKFVVHTNVTYTFSTDYQEDEDGDLV